MTPNTINPRMKFHCPNCGSDVAPARVHLGYKHCMECGETQAREVRMTWCVAPLNKSNYILVTNPEELKQLNPKRTT
jgi:ribosomal protein L37AE/L43A